MEVLSVCIKYPSIQELFFASEDQTFSCPKIISNGMTLSGECYEEDINVNTALSSSFIRPCQYVINYSAGVLCGSGQDFRQLVILQIA